MAEELAAEVEVYGVFGAIVVRVSAQDTFLRPATTAGAKMVCAIDTVRFVLRNCASIAHHMNYASGGTGRRTSVTWARGPGGESSASF